MIKRTVSIIVPIYNAEQSLDKCVKSILRQTYDSLEILLINDGSTDKSGDICENLSILDDRIKVFHQENGGPAPARNKGLKHATGEYIQFVDADDLIVKNMVEMLMKHAHADLVICGYQNEKGPIIPSVVGEFTKTDFLEHFGMLYYDTLVSSPCNKLYKREIIERFEILFNKSFRYGEDLHFNLEFMKRCETIHVIKDVLYMYNRNKHSLTNTFIPNLLSKQMKIDQSVRDFLKKENAYSKTNQIYIAITFANSVLHAASNIVHPNSPYSKYKKIQHVKNLLHDEYIQKHKRYFNDHLQGKLFRFFLHLKTCHLAYGYFSIKEWLRHHAYLIFKVLRKFN